VLRFKALVERKAQRSTLGRRQQSGQALVMGALAFVAMIGVAGLAVDGGRAYVNRRALQGAADSAADAAMRMLLKDFHDTIKGPPYAQTFTDCQIKQQVDNIASASSTSTSSSGLDASKTVVKFTDPKDNVVSNVASDNSTGSPSCSPGTAALNLCTTANPASGSCIGGLRVNPQFAQQTYLLSELGMTSSVQAATATSAFRLVAPNPGSFYGYSVWEEACVPEPGDASPEDPFGPGPITDPTQKGDIVTWTDNHWSKPNSGGPSGCGPGRNTASSSFKGGFSTDPNYQIGTSGIIGDCSDSTFVRADTVIHAQDCLLQDQGGNGPQPTAPAAGVDAVMVLVDGMTGQGGDYRSHVKGFVSVHVIDGSRAKVNFICAAGSTSVNCIPPDSENVPAGGFVR
jgi:Flp pilus assembly protein TadG